LQSPDIRHVRVGKDNSTITLENEFWEQLRIIAVTRNVAISQLLAEIDRIMREDPNRGVERAYSAMSWTGGLQAYSTRRTARPSRKCAAPRLTSSQLGRGARSSGSAPTCCCSTSARIFGIALQKSPR
jgi:hypothetical protein